MSNVLTISLILFALVLGLITLYNVKKGNIPVKYSVVWFFAAGVVLILGIFPGLLELVGNLIDIQTLSNLIIAIMLTLLLLITLSLTIIVSKQKKLIKILIQEVSLVKKETEKK